MAFGQASSQITVKTNKQGITITEPGRVKLDQLFKQADVVALVRVLSGDTENYDSAVYKAEVIRSFKGAATGKVLYFGPYEGERLGWEYMLFLKEVKEPLSPNHQEAINYGKVQYFRIFNEGNSSMESSYQCGFDGKETSEQCDYGIRVCTDYIKLPPGAATFPPMKKDTPFGCRYVRKSTFESLLKGLQDFTAYP